MDVIRLLPDSVANQIAAGEVIQRPASVIKELVENAIDAGATQVVVNVIDAGKTSIQVIDDGKGMSETDARLSFERHATSKINSADDLFALHTMGFRGEALASIAAVAQVELKTRTPDNELGSQINIEGSRVVNQQTVACGQGCNFTVRNLFYNVPARRKFLKSNQTELNNIMQEMERMTLVNPGVAFKLTHNAQTLYDLTVSTRLQRIVSVFGRKMHDVLLPLEVDTTMCKISGFVGKPESAKKKGAHQFFFVNNRYMRHPYFHKAVQESFNHIIPDDSQVPYFIYINVDPHDIDVNIHPTKTEIKFYNEQGIWQILSAAVRESIGSYNAIPTLDFTDENKLDIPAFQSDVNAAQRFISSSNQAFDISYNPFTHASQNATHNTQALTRDTYTDELNLRPHSADDLSIVKPDLDPIQPDTPNDDVSVEHYQYKGRFIMTAVKSGLMMIEQHRAHVRILYEHYMQQMQSHKSVSQGLLFPELITVSATEAQLLDNIMPSLTDIGFDISSLGGATYSINGIPSELEYHNPTQLLESILHSVVDDTTGLRNEINHQLALAVARRQAIQVGEILTNDEMENLIDQLFATSMPNMSPDGKLILTIINQSLLETPFA